MKTKLTIIIMTICITIFACASGFFAEKASYALGVENASVSPVNDSEINWVVDDLGNRIDFIKIADTKDGYVIQSYKNTYSSINITKYNSNNDFVWEIVDNTIVNFAIAPDGNIYVAGNDGEWGSYVPYLAKYSSAGAKQWKKSFADFAEFTKISGPNLFNISCATIEITNNGIFLAGIYSEGKYVFTLADESTQEISRTGGNFNAVVFKFNIDGQLTCLKDIVSTTANSIRVGNLKKLENGNIVLSGYLNTTATAIPGLASGGGYDGYIMVLDSADLSVKWVRMVHSSAQLYGMLNIRVFKNTIIYYGNTSGSPANTGSLLLLTDEERALWPAGTLLWKDGDALIIGFDGDSANGKVEFINVQSSPEYSMSCAGITEDNDGNYIVLYTAAKSGKTFSRIVKYDSEFNQIWEYVLGEEDNTTQVSDILKISYKIYVLGNSNYRFDTNKPVAADGIDGFIMKFDAFLPVKIAPTVEGGPYYYGNAMPALVDGTANFPGSFSWKSGQSLTVGVKQYTWVFTPDDTNLEPYEGSLTIPVLKANQPAPTAVLTVKEKTLTSIEFFPIENAEYSIDGGKTWKDSPLFEDLKSGTKYNAIYRIKGDNNYNLSEAATSIEIETLNPRSNLVLYIVLGITAAGSLAFFIWYIIIQKKKKSKIL